MLEIGSIVDGKYKVLNKIGQGGMSVVYLVMNERANKQWAIKEVRRDSNDGEEIVKQSLVAETELLKKLQHPNLPSIIDVIETQDSLLIVMDYIEGNPLSLALKNYGALAQSDVVKWAKQLCGVLGYLHLRKPAIIYRDLKPANIMLQPDGNVMVIDFGTAREFKEGRADDTVALGTQGYAAPEQFGVHQTDARTDIYALGATMYHLVTGHNPCEPPYVMHPIRYWNPDLSSGLEQIITKCIQRDPNDRYQSAAELLYDLEHYRQLDLEYKASQSRKWRLFLASAILAVVFLLGSVGFAFAESIQTQSSYSALVARAQDLAGNGDLEQAADYYTRAATLSPTNADAYQGFLRILKKDQVITADEDILLRRLLANGEGSRTSNVDRFKEADPQSYADFAYDLGIAYYFAYEEDSAGKSKAEKYLKDASEPAENDEQKREIASRLATVAQNYEAFLRGGTSEGGVGGLLAEDAFSPRTYWDLLVDLSDGNLAAITGSNYIAIEIYQEIANQVSWHPDLFISSGVSRSELLTQLSNASSGLDALITTDASDIEAVAQAREKIALAEAILNGTNTSSASGASGANSATGNSSTKSGS